MGTMELTLGRRRGRIIRRIRAARVIANLEMRSPARMAEHAAAVSEVPEPTTNHG